LQLARAPLTLGAFITLFLIFNSVILLPFSFGIFKDTQFRLRNSIPAVMLQDNVFIDVVDGMTMSPRTYSSMTHDQRTASSP